MHSSSGLPPTYKSVATTQDDPPEDAVAGQAVIGPDERTRITETSTYPWRAIAWLGLFDQNGDLTGSCTGTFVGPKAILTAGHCLYTEADGWTTDIVVVPGKNGSSDPFGHEFAASWWVPDSWIVGHNPPDFDWGLITLSNDSLGHTVGWLRMADLTDQSLNKPNFMPAIVGYPADVSPPASLWGAIKQKFVSVERFSLIHDIDTAPGESGSAIFSANLQSPNLGDIVGIHVVGTQGFNRATRIDSEVLGDLIGGCTQMGCTLSFVIEPRPAATATPTPTGTATATRTSTPTLSPSPSPTPNGPASTPPGGPPRPFRIFAPQLRRD